MTLTIVKGTTKGSVECLIEQIDGTRRALSFTVDKLNPPNIMLVSITNEIGRTLRNEGIVVVE